jgi:hypothetical protein
MRVIRNWKVKLFRRQVDEKRHFRKLHWRGPDQTVSFHKRHFRSTTEVPVEGGKTAGNGEFYRASFLTAFVIWIPAL